MTQATIVNSTQRLLSVVKQILGIVVGSAVGGITFYPLAMPITLTILLNMKVTSFSNLVMVGRLFWLIPLIGVIIGGLVTGYIGKKKTSFILFNNESISTVFGFVTIFSVLGLEIGFMFSGIVLLDIGGEDMFVSFLIDPIFNLLRNASFALRLGNTSTGIELWLISGVGAIVGVIFGVLTGFLVVLIRRVIIKSRD